MNSGFVPKGNYSLKDLVERVVERRHGRNAIAEVTIHSGKKHLEVERAGERILYHEDGERWESARETIRQALEVGTLTACLQDSNSKELCIPKSDWEIPKGDSFVDSYFTICAGTLQHGGGRSLIGALVYISTKEAEEFLNNFVKENANAEELPLSASSTTNEALAEAGRKGGQHSSLCLGILSAVEKILEPNKDLSAMQVWQILANHKSLEDALEVENYEVYVDGEYIWQNDTTAAKEQKLKKPSFPRYIRIAKESLASKAKK